MDENDKILITASILQPELDPEEGADYEDAIIRYEFAEFVDSFGSGDFFAIYMNMINDVKDQSVENQINLVDACLEKVKEIYEFEFPEVLPRENQLDLDDIYQFLRFLEFEHVDFLAAVWKDTDKDLRKIDVGNFCNKNKIQMMDIVENQCDNFDESQSIYLFLRTYNRDKMIEFISDKTEQAKMMIVLKINFPELGIGSEN